MISRRFFKIVLCVVIGMFVLSGCREKKSENAEDTTGSSKAGEAELKLNEQNEKTDPEDTDSREQEKEGDLSGISVKVRELLAARNPYIGNASADGKLIGLIGDYYGIEQSCTMELQTSHVPYGISLHFKQEPDNVTMQKAAGLLIGLIDNCYSVSWDYPMDEEGNRQYFSMPFSAFNQYEDISFVKEYAQSEEKLMEYIRLLEQIDRELPCKVRTKTLEEAAAAGILEYNHYGYPLDCEAFGEGHQILCQEEKEESVMVYALTMYGVYQFQDGNFVKNGGCGVIPAVIRIQKEPDGCFVATHFQKPEDGGGYEDSIKKLFPEKYWKACLSPNESVYEDLKQQEQAYAKAYLKQLGREAAVGEFRDFPHKILSEVGVSAEVSNRLGEIRSMDDKDPTRFAPFWLGNLERVEDGRRYVYEKSYDEEAGEIVFSKIQYETGEVVKRMVYDSLTGEQRTP